VATGKKKNHNKLLMGIEKNGQGFFKLPTFHKSHRLYNLTIIASYTKYNKLTVACPAADPNTASLTEVICCRSVNGEPVLCRTLQTLVD
jgi:hypothetical protein